jgi:DNA invertase Pin-like site-specific DNA recombinase
VAEPPPARERRQRRARTEEKSRGPRKRNVSTDGQELDSQLDALKAAGAVKVFKEKESGIKTDRKELARAIAALDKGDVLLVTRLDRLARSTLDLLNTLE